MVNTDMMHYKFKILENAQKGEILPVKKSVSYTFVHKMYFWRTLLPLKTRYRVSTLWKFVAENHTENFATLKITLKNNIKEVFTENYTEKRPLLFWNAKNG